MIQDLDKHSMEKLMRICYKMDIKYKYTDTLKALRVTVKTVVDNKYVDDLYLGRTRQTLWEECTDANPKLSLNDT